MQALSPGAAGPRPHRTAVDDDEETTRSHPSSSRSPSGGGKGPETRPARVDLDVAARALRGSPRTDRQMGTPLRHTPKQIIRELREGERLIGTGQRLPKLSSRVPC